MTYKKTYWKKNTKRKSFHNNLRLVCSSRNVRIFLILKKSQAENKKFATIRH